MTRPRGYGEYQCANCGYNGTGRFVLARSENGGVKETCDGACENG